MTGKTFTDPPQPYWIASTGSTDYPALGEDLKIDVAVVGGGLVGITTAYLLKQSNLAVAVIEADRIGQGTSGHTTAKVTSQHSLISVSYTHLDVYKRQRNRSPSRQRYRLARNRVPHECRQRG